MGSRPDAPVGEGTRDPRAWEGLPGGKTLVRELRVSAGRIMRARYSPGRR